MALVNRFLACCLVICHWLAALLIVVGYVSCLSCVRSLSIGFAFGEDVVDKLLHEAVGFLVIYVFDITIFIKFALDIVGFDEGLVDVIIPAAIAKRSFAAEALAFFNDCFQEFLQETFDCEVFVFTNHLQVECTVEVFWRWLGYIGDCSWSIVPAVDCFGF